MEIHSTVNSVAAKRLWNVVRITFFMIRKGLISKRKLIMDMNLMMKRGKLLRKSLSNLMSHHHHHHHHHHSKHMTRGSFGIQEYEFSCSNSPNPVFFHASKRKHHYFPCINPPEVIEEEDYFEQEPKAVVLVPRTPEYTFNFRFDAADLAPGENRSPLPSPFSVRVSNYSSEDENDTGNGQVDDEAEEFIRRFYEQLRVQSRMQLLQ
ncbi:Avr9/Cf-9 rapidly elicited protein [Melia azedarach]|uniref:Avr9/Cf-9 rapidly elicited protein n=1 Tax=Melia azedarach TaxID=155640 RepID=A0ACC1Z2A2_MELAZ|nr:Avr9/Cf-9 rapidly elicited protein [Melia azedarach]